MDKFKNCIPTPPEHEAETGIDMGFNPAAVATKAGDGYGLSKAELETGFSVDSYAEAGMEGETLAGRIATKRIDV